MNPNNKKVELFRDYNPTTRVIDAEIADDSTVTIGRQDLGDAPLKYSMGAWE